MARHSSLRASDADREHIADRLREAAAEGRLLAEELEQRMASALRARTYGELEAVIVDLPAKRPTRRAASPLARVTMATAIVLASVVVIAIAAAVLVGMAFVWAVWVICLWGCRRRLAHSRMLRHGGPWQVSRHADWRARL